MSDDLFVGALVRYPYGVGVVRRLGRKYATLFTGTDFHGEEVIVRYPRTQVHLRTDVEQPE